MSKLGIHSIIGDHGDIERTLQKCALAGQPMRVVKCVDDFGPAKIAKDLDDRSITVGRLNSKHEQDLQALDSRAVAAGSLSENGIDLEMVKEDVKWYYEIVKNQWSLNLHIDYWECFNEWSMHWEYQAYFYIAMMDLVEQYHYRLALFGPSTGNPPEHAYEYIALATARAKKFGGHVLSLHEYGLGSIGNLTRVHGAVAPSAAMTITKHSLSPVISQASEQGVDLLDIPTLKGTQPYLALRYRTLQDYLKTQRADIPVIITECGQAGGFDFIGTDNMIADLAWYDQQMMQDDYVLGCNQFTLGNWYQSNFKDALPALADYIIANPDQAPVVLPEPEPEDPFVPYVVKVHLLPQDTTPIEEIEVIQTDRQTVTWSADDARRLVKPGQLGSVVYVWGNEDRWTGGHQGIEDYLGVNVELREFAEKSEPDPVPPPSTGRKPLVGVSIAIDGRHTTEAGYTALKLAKLDTLKISTLSSFEEMDILSTIMPDVSKWTMRLYMAGNSDQLSNPSTFYGPQKAHIAKFRDMGGRDLEIHNEPNHPNEGMGTAWNSASEFMSWYAFIATSIKGDFPNMKVGFPGLWPNESVDVWLANIGDSIAEFSDIIYIHTYWQQRGVGQFGMDNSDSGGRYWDRFANRFPNHRLSISECSNNHPLLTEVSYSTRGHELLDYMTADHYPSNMESIFPYILELDNNTHIEQQWATPNNPIPSIIGGR